MLLPIHWPSALSLVGLIWVCLKYLERRKRNPKGLPFPPGPKGYPIIGSLLEHSAPYPWRQYARWCEQYGDLCYFEVLGQSFLVLGSLKTTSDLLEKRSKNYSDRTHSTMVDLTNSSFLATRPYGPSWRKRRRQFHEYFNIHNANDHSSIQTEEVNTLLKNLLDNPAPMAWSGIIRRTFAAIIMRIVYGIHVDSDDNEYVLGAEAVINFTADSGLFGSFLVDHLPFLRYVPSWFPGAGFKRKAAFWRQVHQDVRSKPFGLVKEQMRSSSAPPSVAAKIISKLPTESASAYEAEYAVGEDVTAVAFVAGADTTLSSIHAFFLAMAMYPNAMRQAQDEIDHVIGPDRLPTLEDQSSLPFVQALCKEILRWHNVLPLAIEHMTTEDDEYEGYFIPKGTIVMGNAWSILHNESTFENPFEFIPSRYLDKEGEVDHTVLDGFGGGTFGFGRRICPGRYFAMNSIFLVVSNLLAVFDILPPLGPDGRPEELTYKTTSGNLIHTTPVAYRFNVRNHRAEELIRSI